MGKKTFYIIGNWKSNKTIVEATDWVKEFTICWRQNPHIEDRVQIILCPAYIHLNPIRSFLKGTNLPVQLGAQDISPFPSGIYTGAICAEMVKDLVDYVIIGHSERRSHFHEEEKELHEKIKQAKSTGLKVIYCIQNEQMQIPQDIDIVAYEPMWAISKGDPYATKPEDPEAVARKITIIKNKNNRPLTVIYGGSTTAENVSGYSGQSSIDGVLPGGASLKAESFYRLIQNACL